MYLYFLAHQKSIFILPFLSIKFCTAKKCTRYTLKPCHVTLSIFTALNFTCFKEFALVLFLCAKMLISPSIMSTKSLFFVIRTISTTRTKARTQRSTIWTTWRNSTKLSSHLDYSASQRLILKTCSGEKI